MKGILDFLSRYKDITPPDMVVRKKLIQIIEEKTSVQLQEKDIRIIGPVAYCIAESGLKNALFLKKGVILQQLEESLGKKVVRDIQ
ncbi:hypothetical protein IPJ70_03055 [Candidatus Campbellbacteria bacterium]|nr:MAG: hypothetical protein IPJ70_03055 [Candidatus Campbellbacteria bacterium]